VTVVSVQPSTGDGGVAGLEGVRFAVVDVETNGLRAERDRIVQVAVITINANGTVLDRWSTLVRPRWRRVGRTDIHGIDRAAARKAPRFAAIAGDLVRHLEGAVFTAHHAPFDRAFIDAELARAGRPPVSGPSLCTLSLSRSLDPDRLLTHTLPAVCERHGVVTGRLHDAVNDASAAALLVPVLLQAGTITDLAGLDAVLLAPPPPPVTGWRRYLRRYRSRRRAAASRPTPARAAGSSTPASAPTRSNNLDSQTSLATGTSATKPSPSSTTAVTG
jgi:DNA polymerase III epsilon subunit-like protein